MLVLITSFPKSGSTYLFNVLSCLPGYQKVFLVPGYDRREQELCRSLIDAAKDKNGVAHYHVRASEPTLQLIDEFRIKPIVLVRDIHDALLSLAEHVAMDSPVMPMAYFDDGFVGRPLSFRLDAAVELAAAWYVNFYVSWYRARPYDIVTYEDVVIGGAPAISRLLARFDIPATIEQVEAAIGQARHLDNRFNVGKAGRGKTLMTAENLKRLEGLASFYDDIDFAPIGLRRGA